MTASFVPAFRPKRIEELVIDDERFFAPVSLYGELKEVLRRDGYVFRVLPAELEGRWDRALFLNLTFWGVEGGGDVLVDDHLAADVVAHVAWHHLASRALGFGRAPKPPSATALFFGEAIASAFDLYLVGRLIRLASRAEFLETQIAAMSETTLAAGLEESDFEALLGEVAENPERAFEDLRQLLFDASVRLAACRSPEEALAALCEFDGRRFAALLHRYELSNWVLFARLYGSAEADPAVIAVDATLRAEGVSLDWLARNWLKA